MADQEMPQLYLITPPEIDLTRFPEQLAQVLDAQDVACLRLSLSTTDESMIARAADACRAVAHERDVALVIAEHFLMVEHLGLDGVHLSDGARLVRKARAELGTDAIVGSFCGASRHEGMNAGEAGADYVSFGPVGETALGDGGQAEKDLFAWWSDMIEVPVVAEGALNASLMTTFAPVTDFFAIGNEVWNQPDPVTALNALVAAMQG